MTDQLKQLAEAATPGEWRFSAEEVAANGKLIAALVNAYRAGELIPASEARAQVAVAYEVAANFVEKGCDVISAAGFTEFARSAREIAPQIRTLTPDLAATALEQIKQEARDKGKREALGKVPMHWTSGEAIRNAILATLSADTQENSDE